MKISYNWLLDFVDIPKEKTPKQLAHELTMSTVEVEGIEDLKENLKDVIVGVIKELKKHPDADRLTIAITDLGSTHGVKEIVCGGSNLAVGMLVAVSIPGAKVYWHGESKLTTVTEAKVRGVKSFGMICASEELRLTQIFPAKDEKEIIDLSKFSAKAGQNLSEVIGYDDFIFEVDNKSLTNRPDLWGHYGIAREFAAIYGLKLKEPKLFDKLQYEANGKLKVTIDDPNLCRRYTGIIIEGVHNCETPFFIRSRLSRVGSGSHGFLVDLTNYVMLTLGQPTHVFDRTKIKNDAIFVRQSKAGEELVLLDKNKIKLTSEDLVIADDAKPVAVAGVIGGLDSAVSSDTKSIIFECANFNAGAVRKTSALHGVRTDSSSRFEKSLDPEQCVRAGKLFLELLVNQFPEAKIVSAIDCYPNKPSASEITTPIKFFQTRLGTKITSEEITQRLVSLGFLVVKDGENLKVQVPSWRSTGDVSISEDLVEEVARIIGYDNLPPATIDVNLERANFLTDYHLEKSIKNFLSYTYQEVYTYPWVSSAYLKVAGVVSSELYSLVAPPDPETSALRPALFFGLAGALVENLRYQDNPALFEMGKVFKSGKSVEHSRLKESLPEQPRSLAGIRSGTDKKSLFFELKGLIEELFIKHGYEINFSKTANNSSDLNLYAEYLEVRSGQHSIGYFGILKPVITKFMKLQSNLAVAYFELDFDKIKALPCLLTKYNELPKYPAVNFDLALVFDTAVNWQDIQSNIIAQDALIRYVQFMDEYNGEKIPTGKKSIALRMNIRSDEKTLKSEEVNIVVAKVLEALKAKLGGELRKE